MANKKKINTGIAGEFFVAAELTRRGYVASLTSKNTKTIDILASNEEGSKSVAIQVKTCDYKTIDKWMMTESVEKTSSDNLFYVLVNMNEGGMPSYYIIPSTIVADKIKTDHQIWINSPGANGQEHHPTTMRTFVFDNEDQRLKYKDAWDLLGL
jgi:hypothetical protein